MLGQRICELRGVRHWSQVELARRLGVTKQTVSNWENEYIQPSVEMLVQLAGIFRVTTDFMLGLENTPRISVEGLTPAMVGHLSLLIDDLQGKTD